MANELTRQEKKVNTTTAPPVARPPLTRLHYRADTPDVYAVALTRLVRHARESSDDFSFGPVRVADCIRDGLTLTGPDLTGPVGVLAAITGLAQVDV